MEIVWFLFFLLGRTNRSGERELPLLRQAEGYMERR